MFGLRLILVIKLNDHNIFQFECQKFNPFWKIVYMDVYSLLLACYYVVLLTDKHSTL